MNLPAKLVPNTSIAASALPSLKKGALNRGLAVLVSLTFLFPFGVCFLLILMDEDITAESVIALLVVGLLFGSICGFIIKRFYSNNAEICCTMVNSTYIQAEDSHISGVALQRLIPNAATPFDINTFYGKNIKAAEFDIAYRQITNVEIFDLTICNIDFGKCCTIHTANIAYSFFCMNSDEIYALQAIIREKVG